MTSITSKQNTKADKAEQVQEAHYCLRWNNFQANITSQFSVLRGAEDFTDVTIICEGQRVQAHKVVLSACSPVFKDLFKNNPCQHPIIFMQDTDCNSVRALIQFMYTGEVNVDHGHLPLFLRTAKSFQIHGLANCDSSSVAGDASKEVDKPHKTPHVSDNNDVLIDSVPRDPIDDSTSSSEARKKHRSAEDDHHDLISLQSVTFAPKRVKEEGDATIEVVLHPPKIPPDSNHFIAADPQSHHVPGPAVNLHPMEMLPIPKVLDPHLESFEKSYTGPACRSDPNRAHALEPRTCEECGITYSNLSNLRQHLKLVHFPTTVACTMCTKSFKTDLYLRRHIKSSHDHLANVANHNSFHNYIGPRFK